MRQLQCDGPGCSVVLKAPPGALILDLPYHLRTPKKLEQYEFCSAKCLKAWLENQPNG